MDGSAPDSPNKSPIVSSVACVSFLYDPVLQVVFVKLFCCCWHECCKCWLDCTHDVHASGFKTSTGGAPVELAMGSHRRWLAFIADRLLHLLVCDPQQDDGGEELEGRRRSSRLSQVGEYGARLKSITNESE